MLYSHTSSYSFQRKAWSDKGSLLWFLLQGKLVSKTWFCKNELLSQHFQQKSNFPHDQTLKMWFINTMRSIFVAWDRRWCNEGRSTFRSTPINNKQNLVGKNKSTWTLKLQLHHKKTDRNRIQMDVNFLTSREWLLTELS